MSGGKGGLLVRSARPGRSGPSALRNRPGMSVSDPPGRLRRLSQPRPDENALREYLKSIHIVSADRLTFDRSMGLWPMSHFVPSFGVFAPLR